TSSVGRVSRARISIYLDGLRSEHLMTASKRITLVDKEDMTLDLEYGTAMGMNFAILHLPKMKLTKTSYSDFLATVPQIYEFISTVGYEAIHTAIDPNDKSTAKLLDRLGAVRLGNDQGLDVYEYRGEV
ncbi:MAG TPA: hypothetical protein V6D20_19740, partial [Candidatus Obscuribacterales bacterium]